MNIPESNSKQCSKCHLMLTLDHFEKKLKSCKNCMEIHRHNTNMLKQYKYEYMDKWMEINKEKYKDVIKECNDSKYSSMETYTHIRANYDPIPDFK